MDQPFAPLCMCNLNYTSSGANFCTVKGWDCSYLTPYYFGLLNSCRCPNPINATFPFDVAPNITACAAATCGFVRFLPSDLPSCFLFLFVCFCVCDPIEPTICVCAQKSASTCIELNRDMWNNCRDNTATSAADRTTIDSLNSIFTCPDPSAASTTAATAVAYAAAVLASVVLSLIL